MEKEEIESAKRLALENSKTSNLQMDWKCSEYMMPMDALCIR